MFNCWGKREVKLETDEELREESYFGHEDMKLLLLILISTQRKQYCSQRNIAF